MDIPDLPGVYFFFDKNDNIIYIGKAKSLKKRVASHLAPSSKGKSAIIRRLATKIEYMVVNSEVDALLLEHEMIKKFQPLLNVKQRDSKSFPLIEITMNEKYPRVLITRQKENPKSMYLGPFLNVTDLRALLKMALQKCKVASCKRPVNKYKKSCLYFDLKMCLAPCVNPINVNQYTKNVDCLINFFKSDPTKIINELEQKMWIAAQKLNYELAASIRDKIFLMKKLHFFFEDESPLEVNALVIAIQRRNDNAAMTWFKIKEGRFIEGNIEMMEIFPGSRSEELIEAFLINNSSIIADPDLSKILFPPGVKIKPTLLLALRKLLGRDLDISNANSKIELKLVQHASRIGAQALKSERYSNKIGLIELPNVLGINNEILKIHAFDASTLQGKNNVGARVSFENGSFKKEEYRTYNIPPAIKGDPWRIHFIVYTSYKNLRKKDLPDLILIDGGLSQVNAAKKALDELGLNIPIIGIAKPEDVIYFPNNSNPLHLKNGMVKRLLQTIRDEVHDKAISFHRRKRRKKSLQSVLDNIRGIGESRKKCILENFTTIEDLLEISLDTLIVKCKIPKKVAIKLMNAIKKYSRNNTRSKNSV